MGLHVGFLVYFKNTLNDKNKPVWGDELLAQGLAKLVGGKVYTTSDLTERLDLLVSMSDIAPKEWLKDVAKRNVLYIQGFTPINGDYTKMRPLDEVYDEMRSKYDSVVTASTVLAKLKEIGFLLPFTGLEGYGYRPLEYKYDVSWIGNTIKPSYLYERYLKPLSYFNYGLFGGDFGKVSHEEGLNIINSSKINLSFGYEDNIKWDMVTARPFYHSQCKAFTIMDKVPYFMKHFCDCIVFTEGEKEEEILIKQYTFPTAAGEWAYKRVLTLIPTKKEVLKLLCP